MARAWTRVETVRGPSVVLAGAGVTKGGNRWERAGEKYKKEGARVLAKDCASGLNREGRARMREDDDARVRPCAG